MKLDLFSKNMHLHLIGVAGSGMSGLARMLLDMGHAVSGSDKVSSKETDSLQQLGLRFFCPHYAESVIGADAVIFSSAIMDKNPVIKAAKEKKIPLCRRAEVLAEFVKNSNSTLIAGTHGKTTSSAMLAHIFRNYEPSSCYYIGAEVPLLGKNAHWQNNGKYFVAEGDESDGTLSLYHPNIGLILNIESEHLDFYKNGIQDIKKVFHQFIHQCKKQVFYCGDDEIATEICKELPTCISYGFDSANYFKIKNFEQIGQSSSFFVEKGDKILGEIVLNIPGRHNCLNALGVLAVADFFGVNFNAIKEALSSFRAAKRRFEIHYEGENYCLLDDYAHHPSEIRATLQAVQSLKPKRIVCIFQPHRFSRTQFFLNDFAKVFAKSDVLLVSKIYPASEKPIPGISGASIISEIEKNSPQKPSNFFYEEDFYKGILKIGNLLQKGDVILTLGAGNIHKAAAKMAKDLRDRKSTRLNSSH